MRNCTILIFAVSFLVLAALLSVECKVSRGAASKTEEKSKKATHDSRRGKHHRKTVDEENDDDDEEHENDNQKREHRTSGGDDEDSIEDVDEDKIDDIVEDNEKNLVIMFYDTPGRCPECKQAVQELEEIDDDLEAAGYIEVVKSDDKKVARELGIYVFPALVYFRRKNPILYDGEFSDSESILKWIRAHEYVVTEDLDDNNFEEKTDCHSPSEGALDWFVMFYSSKHEECNSYVAVWETIAHRLRGIVHVGKVDVSESDDVAERFHIDEDDCPTFLFFRKGKMFRYKETARDVKSFVNFALLKFKEQRGHKIPEPPTLLEGLYEDVKEEIQEKLGEHTNAVLAVCASLVLTAVVGVIVWATRVLRSRGKAEDKRE